MEVPRYPVSAKIKQSPPIDFSIPFEREWIKGKTIVITGGASGFGESFLKDWAKVGACIVIGDINVERGDQLVREVRKSTANEHLHFVQCDVAIWESQVNFFKQAIKFSSHGGIDAVIANAGIAEKTPAFELPEDLDGTAPPPPKMRSMDVNVTGVLYTAHLALFYLPRNPGSSAADPASMPAKTTRDRHLILMGSVASLAPIPGSVLYGVSKHAVLGLFRNLRASSHTKGVRVNLLCPYFIDTPLLSATARAVLAGGAVGDVKDVLDAATRLMADTRIVGRSMMIGRKMKVEQQEDGEWTLVQKQDLPQDGKAVWEAYAEDFEDSEVFMRRIVGLMNGVTAIRGWAGWFQDIVAAILYKFRGR